MSGQKERFRQLKKNYGALVEDRLSLPLRHGYQPVGPTYQIWTRYGLVWIMSEHVCSDHVIETRNGKPV
jgi:hypothetical protein